MKLELSVKSQSVETSGITKDYREAICEYIWNGFEANATQVEMTYTDNGSGGVSSLTISDNGTGIDYDTLDDTFGAFLASQKSGLSIQLKSRANKGKGRFSFLAFAAHAQWVTTYSTPKGNFTYQLELDEANKNECDVTDPIPTANKTGTQMSIVQIPDLKVDEVSFVELEETLLKTFAWFLYLNREQGIRLIVNGVDIDYHLYINEDMSITKPVIIDNRQFTVNLIVWAERIKENFSIYYLDQNGTVRGKDTTTFNRNTLNYNHSVFVQSAFFKDKDGISLSGVANEIDGQVEMGNGEEDKKILKKLNKEIQKIIADSIDAYMVGQAERAIQGMVKRKSFPKFSDDLYGQMQKRDLEKVTKEIYRLDPQIFYKLRPVQEKSFLGLLNLLLNSEERENVLSIIESVVDLSPEQRADFANILKKTRLENIVTTIKFIEDRYTVIEGLKKIVFNYARYANERDNIQKIVERHYWLFGEQFNLVTADKGMQRALQEYLYILYGDAAPDAQLTPSEELMRRMDIFACGTRKVEDSVGDQIEENLVLELKSPSIILSKKVLRQIEDYMDFIRKQPQFNSQFRRWKFIAVCKEVDEDIKSRYVAEKAKGKKGLVTEIENYEVYALTWDDVFKSFELSHGFALDKLKMDRELIIEEIDKQANASSTKEAVSNITDSLLAVNT